MNYAIGYFSTAFNTLNSWEVMEILFHAEINNNENNIRGFLIYSGGNFFGVLEGEKKMISELFVIIQKDPRHKNIMKIFEKEVVLDSSALKTGEKCFISHNTEFQKLEPEEFYECIINLDLSTQGVVNKMLDQFSQST